MDDEEEKKGEDEDEEEEGAVEEEEEEDEEGEVRCVGRVCGVRTLDVCGSEKQEEFDGKKGETKDGLLCDVP